jgi:outer membrane protein assembly factor BamB
MKSQIFLFSLLFLFAVSTSKAQPKAEDNWMQWRGPLGNGVAVKANPPVDFSETKNLKWKTSIPGRGNATPIVYEDKIIILTAVPTDSSIDPQVSPNVEHNFNVILVNRNDGSIIWEKTVATDLPQGKIHELSSWASNSPCTDGEMIYAYFGSFGLYCLDFDGNIIWKRDFGTMEKRMNFGDGASPYLYKDRLFIQWDHEGDSWIYCVDKKNGNDIWKMERDEPTSWSTPFVVEANGKTQVITSATTAIIPVPMVENNMLYVTSGFRGAALQAIDLTKASGDITGTDAIIWEYNQDTPYTPCALLMDGKLYFLRANNGVITCLDAKDGSVNYSKERLEGISTIFSSPSGADGKIYIAAKGICLVIKAGETFEILNSNKLDDNFHASPVFVDKQLILRGFESLYCFEE